MNLVKWLEKIKPKLFSKNKCKATTNTPRRYNNSSLEIKVSAQCLAKQVLMVKFENEKPLISCEKFFLNELIMGLTSKPSYFSNRTWNLQEDADDLYFRHRKRFLSGINATFQYKRIMTD